jgi:LytS/YehU family sensor histidine kinase
MENQINELKTSALQAQMNPHFVFNCLNAIQSFIANQQTEKATRYLARFALLVRNNLNASTKKIISLEEEIQTISNYLSFEKMRFQKKFDYEIIVDPSLRVFEITIPPLLTLPYVENAVIHGLLKSPRPGSLTIKYTKDEDYILAEFIDNGLGIFQTQKEKKQNSDQGIHKSVGMSISRKRLRLFNGRKNEDDIKKEEIKDDSGKVSGTHITLRIKIK